MVLKRRDYGLNEIEIVQYPEMSIASTGRYIGSQILQIKVGKGIKLTNKQLWDYINTEFPLIDMCMFTSETDPMEYSKEIWSFVKYCNSFYKGTGYRKRWWGIITPATAFDSKVLYELDDILIDIASPSSGTETSPEFISWSFEDPNIKDKVQFRMILTCTAPDISFARTEIPKLGTFRTTITLQPLYKKDMPTGWKSYAHFVSEFLGLIRYPYVRILPDLVKILGIKQ